MERAEADIFDASSETAALCREIDWSATALGPVEEWPGALRTMVRSCLTSPFPINLWCGPDLNLIYNDGYANVLGDKHPEALGKSGREVWSEIWPQIEWMFERIRAGGPPIYADDAPFVIQRGGGEHTAYYTFSLSPVKDEDGAIIAFLNVVSETTGRVLAERAREAALAAAARAEARLREVFAQAPSFLAVVRGDDHIFEYVNSAYYQLVGHRELVGKPVFEALPEVRGQGFETILKNVVETGRPFIGREVPVKVQRTKRSEPEDRFIDVAYYPITEPDGSRSGVVAHGSDVTEHVLARQEAQRARAEAEEANRAKSQFLAHMSHEIRTPINAVLGYTDLLDAGVAGTLNDRQQNYLGRIKSSSQHLLGLVNDILDLSKIEAGEMLIRPEDTPIHPIVREVIQIVAAECESRGLRIFDDCNCPEQVVVHADVSRVRQILLNLLSNALKFTPKGGSIIVRCEVSDKPPAGSRLISGGPWLVIEVEDTGIGIAADQLDQIFEPFVQAESGLTRTVGGTGLGLSISRRLARLMNGELVVQSEPSRGSTFSLWLPVGDQRAVRGRTWE